MTDAINVTDLSEAELANLLRGRAGNKYRNRKTTVDGLVFDSALEARYWQVLQIQQQIGTIRKLDRQVWVTVQDGFTYNGKYVRPVRLKVDFTYEERWGDGWLMVFDDTKGKQTAESKVKWKLLQHKYRGVAGVLCRLTFKA